MRRLHERITVTAGDGRIVLVGVDVKEIWLLAAHGSLPFLSQAEPNNILDAMAALITDQFPTQSRRRMCLKSC